MSVNYSSSVGYGIAFTEDDAPAFLKEMDPYEDGNISSWLEANGYDQIGYDYCGNWMSGPYVYFFYAKGTELLNAEVAYMEVIYDFASAVRGEARDQLIFLAGLLGVPTENVGWKLIANVS